MIWTTDKMVSLLEKTEISDVLQEAFLISGNSFSYRDNITLKTIAYSESQEFLSTVRSCPLRETAKRYKVRQITENSVVRGYLIVDKITELSEDSRNLTETVLLAIKLLLRQTITKKNSRSTDNKQSIFRTYIRQNHDAGILVKPPSAAFNKIPLEHGGIIRRLPTCHKGGRSVYRRTSHQQSQ